MISRQVTRLLSRPNIWHHVSRSATISSSFSPDKGFGKKKKKDELTSTSVLSDSYDKMINSLTSDPVIESQLPDQVAYFRNMFNSNVMDGKMNRGNAVVQSFLCIRPSASADDILSAHAVGWSLEVTQAGFLIADDIMDGSITRRGRPCWYKVPSVGLMAVNDVISMQTAAYELVSHFVHNHTMYTKILELLTTCYRFTVLGQSLDTMTSPRPGAKPDFANFTMRKYATITKYKTAYYTISHPVRFGMLLANLTDPLIHSEAEKILLSMGHFFQIQDDYLDCFGDPNVTGKIGRDIEEGKCCWPVVTAMPKCTPDQLQMLKANYGIDDATAVSKIKDLYAKLGIAQEYAKFEESENERLNREIDAFVHKYPQVPREIFSNYLSKLFKRKK